MTPKGRDPGKACIIVVEDHPLVFDGLMQLIASLFATDPARGLSLCRSALKNKYQQSSA